MVRYGGVVGVLVAVQVLLAWLLLGLFHSPTPRDVPVALVGTGPVVAQLTAGLEKDGIFKVRAVDSGAAARKLIDERKIYGAYAPRAKTGRVLVASAASAPVAGLLQTAFGAIDTQRKAKTVVTELKPLPKGDVAGVSAYFLVLVIAVIGVLAGWWLELIAPSVRRGWKDALVRVGALAGFSLLTGVLLAFVATQLDIYGGYFLEVAAITALATLGAAAVTAVLTSQLGGTLGLISGLTVFITLGVLASSGGASAPEFLPDVWKALGSVLPPRAAIDAIRDVVYFDGKAITTPLAVLGAWAVAGIVLMLGLSPFRRVR